MAKDKARHKKTTLLKAFYGQHIPLTSFAIFFWIKEKFYYQNKQNLR